MTQISDPLADYGDIPAADDGANDPDDHTSDYPPADLPADINDEDRFPYLATLNERQREAVVTLDGPVLVLAGAGTGKTRALTTRLAHILNSGAAMPGEILSVTFTNKAAGEMKDRVSKLIGRDVEGWWLGTFHSIGARITRKHAEKVGLQSNFTILGSDDQKRLIKQIMELKNIDTKKVKPKMILGRISRWKDQGLTPDRVTMDDVGPQDNALQIYREYQARLKTLNACDFGDLLLHPINLFKSSEYPEVLDEYHRRFKYILVDEYQDTNVAQYQWLRLLAQRHQNICCVGDDDQSIYGWRGAEIENILRFEHDFPGATVIRLEQNYRSTTPILKAAGHLIQHNEDRMGKELWTAREGGEPIKVKGHWDGRKEARDIAEDINGYHREGIDYNDMAILVRASFQMRAFEERFNKMGLPYRVIGGPRFYERMEIRDAVAYLRVVVQPDDDLAFERIINTPKRGIGAKTVQQLYQYARGQGVSLYEGTVRILQTDELRTRAANSIRELVEQFDRWRRLLNDKPHTEMAEIILDESGYTKMWQEDDDPKSATRLENLKELIGALGEFDDLGEFLEHISLVMATQESAADDAVTLMTLHAAKGLEYDTVFLPGWEEGVFPNQRSMDESGVEGLEEERRLAYVGLTRAESRAIISHVAQRLIHGNWVSSIPSRFIDELPDEYVSVETNSALYGGATGGGRGNRYGGGNSGYGGRTVDGVSRRIQTAGSTKSDDQGFTKGSMVFHTKFGKGRVMAVDRGKLDILFDKAGRKTVMESFVRPANS
jgi:DNA helicase-2/ATP-dependent DNA helicase PcrA